MSDETCHWSEVFTGEKVTKSDIDIHAHRFYIGVCVECGKGKQESAGNPQMPNDLTHCDPCFLKLSRVAMEERNGVKATQKAIAITSKTTKEKKWYE